MPNPIERLVALAKKGDRRVLLGGAVVVGGGIGLIVFLNNRQGGRGISVLPTLSQAEAGGGGGGGGSGDLSELFGGGDMAAAEGLTLPQLPDLMPAESLIEPTLAPNLAGTEPIGLPELADYITASPYFGGGALPSLPELGSFAGDSGGFGGGGGFAGDSGGFGGLPELQPMGYTGGSYGNDIGTSPALPTVSGAVSDFRQPPRLQQPKPTVQPAPVSGTRAVADLGGRSGVSAVANVTGAAGRAVSTLQSAAARAVRGISPTGFGQFGAPVVQQQAAAPVRSGIGPTGFGQFGAPVFTQPRPVSNLQVYQSQAAAPVRGFTDFGFGQYAVPIPRSNLQVYQPRPVQQQAAAPVRSGIAPTGFGQFGAPVYQQQAAAPVRSGIAPTGFGQFGAPVPTSPQTAGARAPALVVKPRNRIDTLR